MRTSPATRRLLAGASPGVARAELLDATSLDESGALENAKVLRDRLDRHGKTLGELCDGGFALLEPGQDRPAGRICESRERDAELFRCHYSSLWLTNQLVDYRVPSGFRPVFRGPPDLSQPGAMSCSCDRDGTRPTERKGEQRGEDRVELFHLTRRCRRVPRPMAFPLLRRRDGKRDRESRRANRGVSPGPGGLRGVGQLLAGER